MTFWPVSMARQIGETFQQYFGDELPARSFSRCIATTRTCCTRPSLRFRRQSLSLAALRNMTARILVIFLMGQLCIFPAESLPDLDFRTAVKLAEEADMVIDFDPVKQTIDLGITQYSSGRKVRFKMEDLEGFFDSQRHKKHIVVIFEKRQLAKPEMTKIIGVLKDYFLAQGYQRVTVQQYLAVGRGTYLDHKQAEP